MKTAVLLLLAATTVVLAQGPLTPPGLPAATMKTLAQIEPRTPISSAPFTITAPGSYYLTTNLTVSSGNAITIATNGVTLDLGGFTIKSTAASATGYGILINAGLCNLAIVNGFIEGGVTNTAGTYGGPGFQSGISYSASPPVNTRVAGVSVSGCLDHGIFLASGDSTVVESCTVRTVGSYGIAASTIKGSVATGCGDIAIYGDQVSDCRGESGSGVGLYAQTAQNCYGSTNSGSSGLYAYTAQNCYGSNNSGIEGLRANYTAQNCFGSISSGSYGLYANTAQNCYGHNSGAGTGLRAGDVAIGCRGYSDSGVGLSAFIANSCRVIGTASITYKYNMP
jgi:hypothetical protein